MSDKLVSERSHWRWWILLFCLFGGLCIASSLIQPLGMSPDEAAHSRYIRYIANERELPVWDFKDGGPAGYESQHPPLFYGIGAAVYGATERLPENWRWQALRWYVVLLGIALFWAARGFFLEFFRQSQFPALLGTSAFVLTPLTVEYCSHINVDILSVLFFVLGGWMCLRVARGTSTRSDRAVLAASLGLGLLTKATALGLAPMIIAAFLWEPHKDTARQWELRRLRILTTFLSAILICGWWYFRNALLYKALIPHTLSEVCTGRALAGVSGFAHVAGITLRNTFNTTWVERGWMPRGAIGPSLSAVLLCLILVAAGTAARKRRRPVGESGASDHSSWLCGIVLISLFVSHQYQVWTSDFAFNAGGRYMLNGLAAAYALLIAAMSETRFARVWYTAWMLVLATMAVLVAWQLLFVLNTKMVPGWHVLKLTIPY